MFGAKLTASKLDLRGEVPQNTVGPKCRHYSINDASHLIPVISISERLSAFALFVRDMRDVFRKMIASSFERPAIAWNSHF